MADKTLFKAAQSGNKAVRDKLIEDNMRLVSYVIKTKFNTDMSNYEDYFQIGCIGLIKAVESYNPNREVTFSTYAVTIIWREIYTQAVHPLKTQMRTAIVVSFEDPLEYDGNSTIADVIPDNNDAYAEVEACIDFSRAMSKLNPSLKRIVNLYADGNNQDTIAQVLGYSQSYVSRLLKKALNILQMNLNAG